MPVKVSKSGDGILRFGLIGHPLEHSLSPYIHEQIMEAAGIRGTYELFDVRPETLTQMLPRVMRNLDGFNCTIPHKERIIPHLTGLDSSASQYGAVNTVYEEVGYNTDGTGFRACKVPMKGRRVLLLGAGGVSRMMGFEAAHAGADSIRIFARGQEKAHRLASDILRQTGVDAGAVESLEQTGKPGVILNGTPLGMWPRVRSVPAPGTLTATAQFLFDSIYNPASTRMLLQGISAGAEARGGLRMLFAQALDAQRIWNPDVDWDEPELRVRLARIPYRLAREQAQRHPVKYVFTGFMGSGKSTIGSRTAREIGIRFVDLDQQIQDQTGKSIPDIFEQEGEPAFRVREGKILADVLSEPGSMVVATGGGAILQPDAMRVIDQTSSLVVFLDTTLDTVMVRVGKDSGRPLLDSAEPDNVRALYESRKPAYIERADLIVDNGSPSHVSAVVQHVVTALGYGDDSDTNMESGNAREIKL